VKKADERIPPRSRQLTKRREGRQVKRRATGYQHDNIDSRLVNRGVKKGRRRIGGGKGQWIESNE
jgi:hypothetical protein